MSESESSPQGIRRWLRHSEWAGIDALVGVIALIVAVMALIPKLNPAVDHRPMRALEIQRLTESILLHTAPDLIPGLEIRYQGEIVDNLVKTVIRVENTGKEAIYPQEWLAPLKMSLSDGAPIIYAEVAGTRPVSLKPSLSYSPTEIQINPLLLNPDDSIIIALIRGGGRYSSLEAQTRIVGIHNVTIKDRYTDFWADENSYVLTFFFGAMFLMIAFGVAILFRFFLVSLGLRAGRWTILSAFLLTLLVGIVTLVWMYMQLLERVDIVADQMYKVTPTLP